MELSPLDTVIPNWDSPTLQGFDTNSMAPGERVRGSARQYVRFYSKTFNEVYASEVRHNEKTGTTQVVKTASRPITKEMVHIITPGDKNEIDDVACDFHRRQFWAQYKAFRDGKTAPLGTSLDECTFVSPSVATELRYLGCHTVEQLADASDLLSNQVANGWELREFARAHCKASGENKTGAQVQILKAELETSRSVIEEMQKQLNEMKGMLLNSKGEPTISAPKTITKLIKVTSEPVTE